MTKDEQEQYCKSNHMTYNRDQMIVFLIRLLDHFPKENLEFLNQKLHKLEVAMMQLCPCVHHVKFREMTQYNNNSFLGWINMLKANKRMEDTPLRIRLGGPRKQFLLPQLWDCETLGKTMGMYIPGRIKEASKGSLVMNLLQGRSESQIEVAKLYWAINEYTEAMARQGSTQLGQVWIGSASYRTFVHIFRSRPRGPIYGVQMSPVIHPSQVMPMPTMANLPAYAAVTPPIITPPKRPRFLPPSETPQHGDQGFTQPLHYRIVGMSHTSVTFQSDSNSNRVPDQRQVSNVTSAKRKIEEQAVLPTDSPQSPQQQIVRPRAPERPKRSQVEQKYFPPGPQKVIRTPIHILKREVLTPPPRSAREKKTAADSPIKELAKLQESQGNSTPSPPVVKNTPSTQEKPEKPLGEVKPIIGSEITQQKPVVQEDKNDETVSSAVSSDNLDLEEMMETASSTESTKSG